MIDLHSHILWGMDDGASDAQETLAMLQAAAAQGVTCMAATSHVYPGLRPFDAAAYAARLEEAQALCRPNGLSIRLIAGAEVAATYQLGAALQGGHLPTLGGSDYVLLELWHDISWQQAYHMADTVLRAGYLPMIAHVERYACFVWNPKKALQFRRQTGACLQLNAGTLLNKPNLVTGHFLRRMLGEQGIDAVVSDAHNLRHRPPNLGDGYRALVQQVGQAYAWQLTHFEVSP